VKLFTIMLALPAFPLTFNAYDDYFSKDGYGNAERDIRMTAKME
jgi:hypothetical protein